jgi:hypothetical protein
MATDKSEAERMFEAAQRASDILNGHLSSGKNIQRLPPSGVARRRPDFPVPSPVPARVPLPAVLYKYLRGEHAESLTRDGNIRIGTLHDFRGTESHGPGIFDPKEGKKVVVSYIGRETFKNGETRTNSLRQMGIVIEGEGSIGPIIFENCHTRTTVDHPDTYVWCCSIVKSHEAMAAVARADTCVEIFDVPGFYDALNRAVTKHGHFGVLGPLAVVYHDLVEEWNWQNLGEHPVFMKSTEFSAQQEARIAWMPAVPAAKLETIHIAESDLHRFCRIVDL